MDLHPELGAALDRALAHASPVELARGTRELSARYRSRESGTRLVRSDADVLAYLAYRVPATYAAVATAVTAVRDQIPDREPRSVLDIGAGPGTASWAAMSVWPGIRDICCVERDERMIAAGKELAAGSEEDALRLARWIRGDLRGGVPEGGADLVIASYALGELEPGAVVGAIDALWTRADGVLVLVEPGTPVGFELIRSARARLIERGGHVAAPCPHDEACPMAGGDWCHFSRRIARSRVHRQAKGGTLGYEDEKFSYVAVSQGPVLPRGSRVIRHPQVRSGHVRLELCTPDGLEQRVVTRKDREAFREARHLSWGDGVPSSSRPPSPMLGEGGDGA
jgi:ribosomal protein RSM22 (predicted rRNA methylase)